MNQASVRRKRLRVSRRRRSSGIPAAPLADRVDPVDQLGKVVSAALRPSRLSFALGVLQLAMSLDAGRKQQLVVVEALESGDGVRDRLDDHPRVAPQLPGRQFVAVIIDRVLEEHP
jgi:hypothetical protein